MKNITYCDGVFSLTCFLEVSPLKTDQYWAFTTKWKFVICWSQFLGSRIQISVYSIWRLLADLVFVTCTQCGFWISVLESTFGVPAYLHFAFGISVFAHTWAARPSPARLRLAFKNNYYFYTTLPSQSLFTPRPKQRVWSVASFEAKSKTVFFIITLCNTYWNESSF